MQQICEAPRRDVQAEPGLQQVGDLGQRHAAVRVQLDDQRDHTGAELCAGRPQRVGGLQGVAALDTPPTLRAVADLEVEAAHPRARRGKVFLILRRRAGHFDRAAAVRTGRRCRRRKGLVDPRRTRAAPLLDRRPCWSRYGGIRELRTEQRMQTAKDPHRDRGSAAVPKRPSGEQRGRRTHEPPLRSSSSRRASSSVMSPGHP